MSKDRHKLSPTWEGPYEVVEMTRPDSYMLQQEDGSEVSNSWNDDQLRPFYMSVNFCCTFFVYCLLHRLLRPILQSGGCIIYSYMFHIMKYYLCCICVIVMQTTSLTSAVKDFA
jgi:hypothetical protein